MKMVQRVSPHWKPLLRSECGFLVHFWKLSYVLVNTSADHNPRLGSVVLHGVNLNFNAITYQVIRNLEFRIFVFHRIDPFGLDLLSWPEPAHPNPATLMSWILSQNIVSNVFQKVFEVFSLLLHRISSGLKTDQKWLGSNWHNRGCDFRLWFTVHLGHRTPCTGWRMIGNLLSKFFIPVRYCSVDTELIDGNNYAK